MSLELLKFAIIFFLPTILGSVLGWYRARRSIRFSWMSWGSMKWSNRLVNLLGVGFVAWKLLSMFLQGSDNFYLTIQSRMDSPSYILRNQYRNYLSAWQASVPELGKLVEMKRDGRDITSFPDQSLLKEFEAMEYLSEQLKIKEKKKIYSKFGERAFLDCKYCSKEHDYVLFLLPSALLEHALFLIVVGLVTSQSFKSNWRGYASLAVFLSVLNEVNNYYFYEQSGIDLYNLVFGEDFFTLQMEKMLFIRDFIFAMFVLMVLIFDYSRDDQIGETFAGITRSLEASLALLQAIRLQKAAVSLNDDLKKFTVESLKKQSFKFADIIADPSFRAKVAESGTQLEVEKMIRQQGENVDKLFELVSNGE